MGPKSVFVADAKAGIGFEFIRQFATCENAQEHIFAAGRKIGKADDLVALAKEHKNVHLIELDVANEEQIEAAVKTVSDVVGENGLNELINNAGVLYGDPLPNIKRDAISHHFDVNATSPLMITQAFLPLLKKAASNHSSDPMSINKAAIINISSGWGSLHMPICFSASVFGWIYGFVASKAALNIIGKNLSFDLKPMGILIVSICPGYVETDMTKTMLASVRAKHGNDAIPEIVSENDWVKPEISVSEIMATMKRLNEKHTGGYFHRDGKKFEDYDFESAASN